MGPRDESGANQPRRANNLDSIEDDEDGQDNGWHIGLDVESQSVGIEVASSNTTGFIFNNANSLKIFNNIF